MKEQRKLRSGVFISKLYERCMAQDKIPSRLNFGGISLASNIVSQAVTSFIGINKSTDVSNDLLNLACNHSTYFTKLLSPVGVEFVDPDDGIRNNQPYNLVTRFHKQCRQNDGHRLSKLNENQTKVSTLVTNTCKIAPRKICICNESTQEERKEVGYLGCWEHTGIAQEDLDNYFRENMSCFDKSNMQQKTEQEQKDSNDWKEFLRNERCTVSRKLLSTGIYEYRILATFNDITARKLFTTQIDGAYRKKWDSYLIDLKVVDKCPETSTDLVQWITKCPYPFASREYVYLRRKKIDNGNKAMLLYQQATDKTNIPIDPKIMRVDTYRSKIIIKAHDNDFDKNGCDFLLCYYDDPKMRMPARVIDLATSKGIVDSVNRMYNAALDLESVEEEKT